MWRQCQLRLQEGRAEGDRKRGRKQCEQHGVHRGLHNGGEVKLGP